MSLYYGRGRTYRVGPYLKVKCGDTEFRTDYFTISETGESSAKERTLNIIGAITVGDDHLLKVNGRTITFTAAHDSSSGKLIDRPYAGNMTLTVNYDVLFSKSDFDLSSDSIDMGTDLVVDVTPNELNAAYTHTAVLALGSLSVSAAKTGPGDIVINIPRTSEWLAALPNSVTEKASLTLTTEGDGQVASVTKYINVLVPGDVVPHFDSLSLARIDGRVPAEWNAFIKGESAALLEIVGAVPGVGASIASYRIEGGGYASNLESLQTGKLTVAGEIVFTATVTDSRGRMDRKTASILVEDYALPFLTEFDAWRTDESGVVLDTGTQIRLRAAYGVSAVHGNTPSFSIFVGSDQVAPTDENSDGSMYTATLAGPWPANRGTEIVIEIRDAVTADSETPASLSFRIPSANVPVHVLQSGGDFGVAFGMYQESTKRLSVPEDWRFYRGEVDIEQKADAAKDKADEAYELAEEAKNSTPTVSMLDAYPVGSIYMSSVATSPAELFGGTWTQITDKFLMAAGEAYAAGTEGGRESVTLSAAIGAGNDDIKSLVYVRVGATDYQKANLTSIYRLGVSSSSTTLKNWNHSTPVTETTGTERGVNIIPPYQAVYVWQRTA